MPRQRHDRSCNKREPYADSNSPHRARPSREHRTCVVNLEDTAGAVRDEADEDCCIEPTLSNLSRSTGRAVLTAGQQGNHPEHETSKDQDASQAEGNDRCCRPVGAHGVRDMSRAWRSGYLIRKGPSNGRTRGESRAIGLRADCHPLMALSGLSLVPDGQWIVRIVTSVAPIS